MRQIAISDIHGCAKTFEKLLETLALTPSDELFILGDYVDRGPDSKGVIDRIWAMQQNGYQVRCLRGNHEELVLRAASGNFTFLEKWLQTDGKDTMDSFGVKTCADIPANYLTWMAELPYFLETGDYILVHAGLDFDLSDPLSDNSEMCWLRNWHSKINYDWLGKRMILHGHTPIEKPDIYLQQDLLDKNQYLDIDCGCVYADPRHWKSPLLGALCAFDMSNRELLFQPNIDY